MEHPVSTPVNMLSDTGLAVAYALISVEILVLKGRAGKIPTELVVVLRLFEAFIFLCGLTHLVGPFAQWATTKEIGHQCHAWAKAAAAAVSLYTAIVFPSIVMKALKLIYSDIASRLQHEADLEYQNKAGQTFRTIVNQLRETLRQRDILRAACSGLISTVDTLDVCAILVKTTRPATEAVGVPTADGQSSSLPEASPGGVASGGSSDGSSNAPVYLECRAFAATASSLEGDDGDDGRPCVYMLEPLIPPPSRPGGGRRSSAASSAASFGGIAAGSGGRRRQRGGGAGMSGSASCTSSRWGDSTCVSTRPRSQSYETMGGSWMADLPPGPLATLPLDGSIWDSLAHRADAVLLPPGEGERIKAALLAGVQASMVEHDIDEERTSGPVPARIPPVSGPAASTATGDTPAAVSSAADNAAGADAAAGGDREVGQESASGSGAWYMLSLPMPASVTDSVIKANRRADKLQYADLAAEGGAVPEEGVILVHMKVGSGKLHGEEHPLGSVGEFAMSQVQLEQQDREAARLATQGGWRWMLSVPWEWTVAHFRRAAHRLFPHGDGIEEPADSSHSERRSAEAVDAAAVHLGSRRRGGYASVDADSPVSQRSQSREWQMASASGATAGQPSSSSRRDTHDSGVPGAVSIEMPTAAPAPPPDEHHVHWRDASSAASQAQPEDIHLLEDVRDQISFALEQAYAIMQERRTLQVAADLERQKREAGSVFLAMMSHEMRTPIHAIMGYISLLLDTPLSADQMDMLRTLQHSGDNLLTLVNDVLDLTKYELGSVQLEWKPFYLKGCIEDAVQMMASKVDQTSVRLNVLVDKSVPDTVVGDITRFRQVLVNLLSNGTKFTHKGEIVIRVSIFDALAARRKELYRSSSVGRQTRHPRSGTAGSTFEVAGNSPIYSCGSPSAEGSDTSGSGDDANGNKSHHHSSAHRHQKGSVIFGGVELPLPLLDAAGTQDPFAPECHGLVTPKPSLSLLDTGQPSSSSAAAGGHAADATTIRLRRRTRAGLASCIPSAVEDRFKHDTFLFFEPPPAQVAQSPSPVQPPPPEPWSTLHAPATPQHAQSHGHGHTPGHAPSASGQRDDDGGDGSSSHPSSDLMLQIEVADTGIGIPYDRMHLLFDKFMQVDASTTRRYGGTGLGLPICHKLAALMGGRCWVVSCEGKGSSFFFTVKAGLPTPSTSPAQEVVPTLVVPGRAPSSGGASQTIGAGGTGVVVLHDSPGGGSKQTPDSSSVFLSSRRTSPSAANIRGQRVVVLDNWPTDRQSMRLQLQALGCIPTFASSLAEAEAAWRSGNATAGITPMHMVYTPSASASPVPASPSVRHQKLHNSCIVVDFDTIASSCLVDNEGNCHYQAGAAEHTLGGDGGSTQPSASASSELVRSLSPRKESMHVQALRRAAQQLARPGATADELQPGTSSEGCGDLPRPPGLRVDTAVQPAGEKHQAMPVAASTRKTPGRAVPLSSRPSGGLPLRMSAGVGETRSTPKPRFQFPHVRQSVTTPMSDSSSLTSKTDSSPEGPPDRLAAAVAKLHEIAAVVPVIVIASSRGALATAGVQAPSVVAILLKPCRTRALRQAIDRASHWSPRAQAAITGTAMHPALETVPEMSVLHVQQSPREKEKEKALTGRSVGTGSASARAAGGQGTGSSAQAPAVQQATGEATSSTAAVNVSTRGGGEQQRSVASASPPAPPSGKPSSVAVTVETHTATETEGPAEGRVAGAAAGTAAAPAPSAAAGVAAAPVREPCDIADMRVLVVEDNVVNQKLAIRMLKNMKVKCDLANNGAEAVEMIQRASDPSVDAAGSSSSSSPSVPPPFRYDLTLMDLDMPVMGGLEATRAIRASVPEQCQPWIVAMTASVFEEDRERCFDAGMDDFLPKPFQQQTLKDILKRYLEHHSRSHVSGGGAAGDGSGGSSSVGSPDELDTDEQG